MNTTKPKPTTHNYNKACDACRANKTRCLPSPSTESTPTCQRCLKTDRECTYTAPQRRKQRKRTDTRVAELEREVQAMRNLFDDTRTRKPQDSQSMSGSTLGSVSSEKGNTEVGETPENVLDIPWRPSKHGPDADVVDKGIVTMAQASQLFQIYNVHLVHHYPAVVFPASLTAEEFRRTKPTLFLAVIAAAAGKVDPHLYSVLNSEVLSEYARRTVIHSEKSLELVQAMLVTSVWYFPPGRFSQLKFYEYVHMAAAMAIDLGMGTNPCGSRRRGGEKEGSEQISEEELQRRRTYLACFVITTNVAMSLGRPVFMRYSSWIEECVESVARNSRNRHMDGLLIGWVRLMKIAASIHESMSFDDLGNIAKLSDTRTQLMVNGFEKELLAWKKQADVEGMNHALLLVYHQVQILLHELALHDDYPSEHFKPPFRLNIMLTFEPDTSAKCTHIDAVTSCITHTHLVFDILLSLSIGELRSLPIFNFARMLYSFVILVKLQISSKSPESKIGVVIDNKSLKLKYYLDTMVNKLKDAVGVIECRAPYTFLGLLLRTRNWYGDQENDEVFKKPVGKEYDRDDCWLPMPRDMRKGGGLVEYFDIGQFVPDYLERVNWEGVPDLDMSLPIAEEWEIGDGLDVDVDLEGNGNGEDMFGYEGDGWMNGLEDSIGVNHGFPAGNGFGAGLENQANRNGTVNGIHIFGHGVPDMSSRQDFYDWSPTPVSVNNGM